MGELRCLAGADFSRRLCFEVRRALVLGGDNDRESTGASRLRSSRLEVRRALVLGGDNDWSSAGTRKSSEEPDIFDAVSQGSKRVLGKVPGAKTHSYVRTYFCVSFLFLTVS